MASGRLLHSISIQQILPDSVCLCPTCTFSQYRGTVLSILYLAGLPVSKEALDEVAEISGVLDAHDDYLPVHVREQCEAIIPEICEVKSKNAVETYLLLKAHYVYSE